MRDCPSGRLDKEGFRRFYHTEFPFGDPGPMTDYLFNAFDQNHVSSSGRTATAPLSRLYLRTLHAVASSAL
jgi:hypothetical protein